MERSDTFKNGIVVFHASWSRLQARMFYRVHKDLLLKNTCSLCLYETSGIYFANRDLRSQNSFRCMIKPTKVVKSWCDASCQVIKPKSIKGHQ